LLISLASFDGRVIDCSIAYEFAGSRRVDGGWYNGQLHPNDFLQARAKVKNNKCKDAYALVQKAFPPAIVSMPGKIHIVLLRLLWILADNQVKSYYEHVGQKDRVGGDSLRWARARSFDFDNTSVGRAVAFACGTCCHLSVHSLAQPHAEEGHGSRGRGPGASRDDAPHSRSANEAGHNNIPRDGGPPSSASHGVAQRISQIPRPSHYISRDLSNF